MRIIRTFYILVVASFLLANCTGPVDGGLQTAEASAAAPQPPVISVTVTAAPAQTAASSVGAADPIPIEAITVAALQSRAYGGELEEGEPLGTGAGFTRTVFWYTSDGVRVAGYASVPEGEGPFPVIILLHGFSENYKNYGLLNYTQRYTDSLAAAGFLVLHPNLRSFAPSEAGPNTLCTGFVIDVLNLIAILQDRAGQPGLLAKADPERIGLWGHSMGAGIAQRVMVASPAVDAVVVYAGMPSDERVNVAWVYPTFGDDLCEAAGLEFTEEEYARISAIDNLKQSDAAVYVAHGETDSIAPLNVPQNLCRRLEAEERTFECHFYPGQGHEFLGEADELFKEDIIRFFRQYLD